MIGQHHTNWRLRAISSLSKGVPDDLHYSSVITISKKDALRIREELIDKIKDLKTVIKDSVEEKLYSLNLDFFEV